MPLMPEISLEIDLTDPVYTSGLWVTCPSENNFAEYRTILEFLLAKYDSKYDKLG